MADRLGKLRGGRRYFRRLRRWPQSVSVNLGQPNWYDLWHAHPDLRDWSLRGRGARRAHLVVLFEAFRRVLQELAAADQPAQVFLAVNTRDSPGDALYVHTPNPNSDNFPYRFDGYSWEHVRVPHWLQEFSGSSQYEVGETVWEGERRYVIAPLGPRGRPTRS